MHMKRQNPASNGSLSDLWHIYMHVKTSADKFPDVASSKRDITNYRNNNAEDYVPAEQLDLIR